MTTVGTVPRFEHKNAGGRLYTDEEMREVALKVRHRRRLTDEDRLQWSLIFDNDRAMFTRAAVTEAQDRRVRNRDVRLYGEVARHFYRAHGFDFREPTTTTAPLRFSPRPATRRPRAACTRSSAASGDGPEDDPHHTESPAASRPASARVFLCLEVVR